MASDLTERQQEVLAVIKRHVKPVCTASYREMMAELGINSPNGFVCHVRALKKKGVIDYRAGRTGIVLVDQEPQS